MLINLLKRWAEWEMAIISLIEKIEEEMKRQLQRKQEGIDKGGDKQ